MLASMIKLDEDALVCDFAETYHIYDYTQLPPIQAAILAQGLRDNSRIKMRMSASVLDPQSLLLAGIADRLSMLIWMQSKDGQTGQNRPKLILDDFIEDAGKPQAYSSGGDFDAAWAELVRERG